MKKLSRAATAAFASAVLMLAGAGIASADDGTAVWLLPGVDLGFLLGPTANIPGALAPVFDLLRFIGG
ncbi:hypothetical protein ACOBQX_11755 [Actinokineospora sp. G85]|uniref:hypothetical protein n=1 Tax=Actinokineospora sp. G85 TaxID=3406626 RepID=UPI003C72A013